MNEKPAAEIESFEDCDRAALTREEVAEMRALLEQHFEGVCAEQFERDLAEKTRVLRVWRGKRLVGFSTLLVYQTEISGESIHVIYSGDTIMAPDAWGSSALARGWIRMVKRIQKADPSGNWYWLLLSAGFRTYRFLPVFWREFWPSPDCEIPDELLCLRETLARERFGNQFDPSSGVVRFDRPQWLKPRLAVVPEGRIQDEHIAYFLKRNPGWREGDELVCLTKLHDENLTAAGRRIVRSILP